MTKYTKKQYLADVAANEKSIEENTELLTYFQKAHEFGITITEGVSKAWNAAHDRNYDLNNEREDIERRWNRRDWTWQDHSEHELVMLNID